MNYKFANTFSKRLMRVLFIVGLMCVGMALAIIWDIV